MLGEWLNNRQDVESYVHIVYMRSVESEPYCAFREVSVGAEFACSSAPVTRGFQNQFVVSHQSDTRIPVLHMPSAFK